MPVPETPKFPDVTSDSTEIRVLLARFETKLDLVLGQHEVTLKDHETRLRNVEDRKCVSPAAMLTTSATFVALAGGAIALLDRLYG
jgi:hypothetical protein